VRPISAQPSEGLSHAFFSKKPGQYVPVFQIDPVIDQFTLARTGLSLGRYLNDPVLTGSFR
jgi:hypothetical protein